MSIGKHNKWQASATLAIIFTLSFWAACPWHQEESRGDGDMYYTIIGPTPVELWPAHWQAKAQLLHEKLAKQKSKDPYLWQKIEGEQKQEARLKQMKLISPTSGNQANSNDQATQQNSEPS